MPTTPIPLEDISRYPLPGFIAPGAFAFSPDDRLVTCLFSPERSLLRQLFAFDADIRRAPPAAHPARQRRPGREPLP